MSDERIDIEVQDKVSPDVEKKILGIASAADKADTGVEKLKKALAGINNSALAKLNQAVSANATAVLKQAQAASQLQASMDRAALANQRLATEQARSAAASAKTALAQQKLATEQQKTAAASMQAETALNRAVITEQRMATVSNTAAASQVRLAAEQQRLGAATMQAEAALARAVAEETNAATAAARLATAQTSTVVATQRLSTATAQTATAQQRTATEMQRTATATAQAAAAQDRAALAALRLQQAQDRAQRSANTLSNGLVSLTRQALTLGATYLGARAVLSAADAYTTLENKLQNVTTSQQQLNEVTDRLFQISNETRSSVETTAGAFQRFDLAMQQLGASQNESLRLTETLNKAIVVSGAATTEASAGMLQLAQAFGSGRLQGDEFRSIMENLPAVADMIAKHFGVARGELKKMSSDGKITANDMRKAFAEAAADMDAKFGKTVPTMGQAVTVLRNDWLQWLGALNQTLGATTAISTAIMFVADNVGRLVTYAASAAAIFGGVYVSSLVAAAVATGGLSGALAFLRAALIRTGIGAIAVAVGELIYQFLELSKSVGGMSAAFAVLGGTGKAALDWIIASGKAMVDAFVGITLAIAAAFTSLWASVQAGFAALMVSLQAGVNRLIDGMNKAFTFTISNPFTGEAIAEMKGLGIEAAKFADSYVKAADDSASAAEQLSDRSNAAFASMSGRFDNLETPIDAFKRLKTEAQAAAKATETAGSALRGAGAGYTPTDEKAGKAAEKRAAALSKVNRELQSELQNLQLVGPAQDIANRMSEIENELLNKKIQLTAQERQAIANTIIAIEWQKGVNKELNSIYDETTGKIVQLAQSYEALTMAYQRGMLGAEQYQIKLVQLGLAAANLRMQMGDGTWSDVMLASIGKVVEGYQGMLPGLTDAFGGFFSSLTDGFANSIGRAIVYGEDLGDALRDVARSALSELISALIKLGIQYVIMQTLGQTLASVATATTALQATAAAAAWAPAAALASLATLGANAAPAAAAVTGTMALTQGMATAGLLGGFKDGGYTGNGGVNDIAGAVHGREYVFDAASTAAIGVDNLDALRRNSTAASSSGKSGTGIGAQLNVSIENYGTSKDFEVQQLSDTDIRIIARDEAKKAVRDEAPGVVAADLGNPNGRTSKAMSSNFTATRKR